MFAVERPEMSKFCGWTMDMYAALCNLDMAQILFMDFTARSV